VAQFPWLRLHNLQDASRRDQIMLNYNAICIASTKNGIITEVAQNCLDHWQSEQQVNNQTDATWYRKQCQKSYEALKNYQKISPLQKRKSDKKILLDCLDITRQQLAVIHNESEPYYTEQLTSREKALIESIRTNKKSEKEFKLNPHNIGFMMAHNINHHAFHNQDCLEIQHCLTDQIVRIIDHMISMTEINPSNPIMVDYVKHSCNLAVAGQQLNQQNQIYHAMSLTDYSEFFALYGQSLLLDDVEGTMFYGIAQGLGKSLAKYVTFAQALYNNPGKTIGDTVQNFGHAAYCLGKVIQVIAEHYPIPSIQDNLLEFTKQEYADFSSGPFLGKLQQNYENISGGCGIILDIGQHLCTTIMNKSIRENSCDLTEFAADMIIPGKIAQAFIFLSNIIAPHLLDASRSLQQMIPEHFMNDAVGFADISQAGDEIVAYLQNTDDIISSCASVIGKTAGLATIDGITYLERVDILEKKLEKLIGPDPEKIKKLKAEFEPFCRSDDLIPGISDIKNVP
jgi:hypothetical protein